MRWAAALSAARIEGENKLRQTPFTNRLDELVARKDIEAVIFQRSRGSDRNDWEGEMLNAYFSDAMDKHGIVDLPIKDFIPWARQFHETVEHGQHLLGNVDIEFIKTDLAMVETCGRSTYRFSKDAPQPNNGPHGMRMETAFRYLDRFECRNDEWRIAQRRLVIGDRWVEPLLQPPVELKSTYLRARRDFEDPYYLMRNEIVASATKA